MDGWSAGRCIGPVRGHEIGRRAWLVPLRAQLWVLRPWLPVGRERIAPVLRVALLCGQGGQEVDLRARARMVDYSVSSLHLLESAKTLVRAGRKTRTKAVAFSALRTIQ